MKRPTLRLLALAPVLCLAACGTDEGDVNPNSTPRRPNQDAASRATPDTAVGETPVGEPSPRHLMPENSFLYAELDSVEALEELIQEVLMTVAPAQSMMMPDSTQALGALAQFGADPRQVRLDQPIGVALTLPPGAQEPLATFILPVTDGPAFARSINRNTQMGAVTQQGNYVGLSLDPGYTVDMEQADAFCGDLPEGLVACRIDVAMLIERFGPMVQMGIAGMRTQLEQQAGDDPMLGAFMGQYAEGVASFVTSAERLDLVVGREGSRLDLDMGLRVKAGSSLDGFGSSDNVDLAKLAGYIDDEDTIAILGSLDASVMDGMVRPLFEAMMAAAPAEVRESALAGMADFEAMAGGDGLSFVTCGHLSEGGVDVSAFVRGVDTAVCATHFQQALNSFASETEDFIALEPLQAEQDGSQFLQLDFVPAPKSPSQGLPLATREQTLATIFGAPRMRVRMVAQEDELILSVGEGASLARKARGDESTLAPDLARALDKIGGASPALLYRVDYQGLKADAAEAFFADFGSDPAASLSRAFARAGDTPAWATVYGAVDGREWRMGCSFDLDRLLETMQDVDAARAMPR